jgi:hypothetical protein
LADHNEKRTLSIFQEELIASEACIIKHKKSISFQRKVLKSCEEIPQKDLKGPLISKCRYQEERFIIILIQLEKRNDPSDFDFIFLMGCYAQLCYHLLRRYSAPF